MTFANIFSAIYFTVLVAFTVGSWLFTRGLNPKQKHYWIPRLSLLSIIVLGPLLLLPPLVWEQYPFALLSLAMIVFIGYIAVAKVRVCDSCGHVTQPDNFF